ncbi:MAG: choice-of-anchor D domain-containing protein [Bacteroidia bacterium]|nr:choice-of-anchor D domain-containing protein [Bacteroidia bacterium]
MFYPNISKTICCLTLLVGATISNSNAQNLLGLDGGLEGSATVDNTNANTSAVANTWTKNNSTTTISYETTTVRSGSKSLKVNNSSTTGRRVWTPLITSSITSQQVTFQFYRLVSNTTNAQDEQRGVGNGTSGTENLSGSYSVPASASTWEKVTYTRTANSYTVIAGVFLTRKFGSGGDMFFDDFTMYTGAVDNAAPNSAGTVTVAQNSSNPTTALDISWTAASGGVDNGGYMVVRYSSSPNADNDPNTNGIYASGNTYTNGTGGLTGTVVYLGTGTSFTNSGLNPGTTYYYKVYTYDKAYNYATESSGNGSTANATTVTIADNGTQIGSGNILENSTNNVLLKFQLSITGAAANLTGLTCTTSGGYDAADLVNLKVRYSTDATLDGGDATLSTLTSPGSAGSKTFPSFSSQSISGGTTGYLFITGDIASGSSGGGNTISINAITNSNVTIASGSVTGSSSAGGTQTIITPTLPVVSGGSPTGTVGTAFSYTISATNSPTSYAIASGSLPAGLSLNTGSGVISGTPTSAGSSSVTVTATNGSGTSAAATLNFTINPGNQTITGLSSTSTQTYGASSYSLTASASSGLGVTYSSSNTGVATISGSTVTIVGPGTTTITASQSGNSDWNAASNQTQTLTVNPKNLTISGLTGSNKTYDAALTASVSGSPSLVGIVGSDVVNLSGTPSYSFATKTVGTSKPITATGFTLTGADAGKYTLSQPSGLTGNITVASLTLTGASANSRAYNGSTAATITGGTLVGVISGDVVNASGAGTFAQANAGTGISVSYNTTLSGADASNYSLTAPVGLSADITKVSLTCTADNLTKNQGSTNPTLTITYSGFVNSETVASITAPTASTTATTSSVAGNYPITLTGGSATNYNLTLVNGTLTVVLVPVTIWTNPITGTNPGLSNPWTSGDSYDANLVVSGIGRSAGINGNSANDRYNATNWSTSGTIDLTKYFEFTLTPVSGYEIDFTSFTYTGQVSSGSSTVALRSSLDGYSSNIGSASTTGATISLSGSAYQNITSAITFRYYAYGLAATTTTLSINDFTFTGNVLVSNAATVSIANTGSPAAGAILNNTTNNVLFGFSLTPSAAVTFTGVSLATSGTATSSDISNFRLVKDADNSGTYNGGDAILGTVATLANPISFTGLSENISSTSNYLLIADVSNSAVDNRTIAIAISAASNVTTDGIESGTATGNTQTIQTPEIRVEGNSTEIVDGDNTPSTADHTSFGNVTVGSSLTRQFTIKNIGHQNVILSGSPLVSISGSSQFTVSLQPSASTISGPAGSLIFEVTYNPTTLNTQTATISISNNDANEGTYDFTISGTGSYANNSTIDFNTAFTTPQNINYLSYQESDLTTSSLDVMQFRIRDGGGVDDGDGQGTTMASVTLNLTHSSFIKRIALYNGSTEIAEQAVSGSTVTFSGLSGSTVTSPSYTTSRIITVKVSFNNTVTDNAQFGFSITSADVTSASSFSSGFTNFSTVSSETTGNRNRVIVTATKLSFYQQPSNVSINSAMTPSPSVEAVDINGNRDLDYSSSISLTSTGTMTGSPLSVNATSGLSTFSVTHTAAGGPFYLSATSGSLTPTGNSNSFTVTTLTFSNGDYRTNPSLGSTGTIYFGSTTAISGIRPWQKMVSGSWQDVTGSSATESPEALSTKPNKIYICSGSYVDVANGGTYNNILIDFPSSSGIVFSGNSSTGLVLSSGSTLELTKGEIYMEGRFEMLGSSNLIIRNGSTMYITGYYSTTFLRSSTSTFTVENGATVEIDSYLPNNSTTGIWNGSEVFGENSQFYITDWDNSQYFFSGTTCPISTTSYNGNNACFGKLKIELGSSSITGNWTGIFPPNVDVFLTHGELNLINNSSYNITLYNGNSNTLTIGGDLLVSGTGNVQGQSGAGAFIWNVNGNLVKNGSGDLRVHTYGSSSAGNSLTLTVLGNMTINSGFFNIQNTSSGAVATTVNLKGNLYKASGSYMVNSNSSGYTNTSFNFTGTTTQTVDLSVNATNDMLRYRFFVKSGAYVQIINRNWPFADQSNLTIENGGILDFNYASGTALNLVETTSSATTSFDVQSGGTIKISSLETTGAIRSGTTLSGNVQLDSRTYNAGAIYHYVGTTNQYTGDGLPTTITGKVLVELTSNSSTLSVNTSSRVINTPGTLEIKKGTLLEGGSSSFFDGTGNLTMGTLNTASGLYQISSVSASTQYPRLTGTYTLTGGVIELNGTSSSSSTLQTLKGGKTYYNILISGTSSGGGYKTVSSALVINNNLEISGSTIFDIGNNGVTGNAGLYMSGSSLLRIGKASFTTLPELAGISTPYVLTNGTIEYYGTVTSGSTQLIRGTFNNGASTVNYYNIEINANSNAGVLRHNVNAAASFQITGTLNVNSPAILQLDATDIVSGTGNFKVNAGATLKYAHVNGINASGNSGNVQTTTRTFATGSSYGFVGSSNQNAGTGLPAQILNLYVEKSSPSLQVSLDQSVTITGDLTFNTGQIVTTSTKLINIDDNATATLTAFPDESFINGPCRKTGNDAFVFPVGKGSICRTIEISAPTQTTDVFTAEYFPTNPALSYPINYSDPAYSLSPMIYLSDNEFWDLARTTGSSSVYVTLNWKNYSSGFVSNLSTLKVAHYNGSYWENLGNGNTSGTTQTGTIRTYTTVSNFSPFALGSEGEANPLPIELLSFSAKALNNLVQLDWITASEINNDYFTIEKTMDGNSYEEVGIVKGSVYSNSNKSYQLLDKNPYAGTSYYRLKQTDLDGSFTYSHLAPVYFQAESKPILVTNTGNKAELGIFNLPEGKNTIKLMDLTGRIIVEYFITSDGSPFQTFQFNQCSSGIYLIEISNTGKSQNFKITL